MSETLPEVSVTDADPATRAIYNQIMTATGVGSPALIYRHFAVFPGFLDWVWDVVGADLKSGQLAAHALGITHDIAVAKLPPMQRDEIIAYGVSAEDCTVIKAMLATYNRMNPINLGLMTTVREILAGTATAAESTAALPRRDPVAAPTASKLPAPLNLDEMQPDVRAAVLMLSAGIPNTGGQVIPTLYRHLAIWPQLLLAIAPGLGDAMQRGEINSRMDDLMAAMAPVTADVQSRALSRGLAPAPLEDPAAMVRTLDSFLYTIPQLVVVGTALNAAMELD
tara:strand:- start:50531 stop:51373 length:843 start_codon:yes stop_codon:yes gene_type:complete